jgi:hypothetical protein
MNESVVRYFQGSERLITQPELLKNSAKFVKTETRLDDFSKKEY